MQFNSYVYSLCFLPIVIIVYFLANKINKTTGKISLLLASMIFYTFFDIRTAAFLAASLFINFIFAIIVSKTMRNARKFAMIIPVFINVLLLAYFKYTNFIISNINNFLGYALKYKQLILPLGISFFTFQQIAYIVAVYRNEISKISLLDYALYILYFPKILMGPLTEPTDFLGQINNDSLKKVDWENILCGLQIFSFGLFKKVMLADTFAKGVAWGFSNVDAATSMDWILIALFYTFEIYFDFSGYSDMAVGSSLMLNISLPINFDSPYKAISVRDFWKRWHMSLTKFFTKYIYIPLGGSRKGLLFTFLNTFIVFFISGVWHGANWTFILWGTIYGLLMIFDRVFDKIEEGIFQPVRWVITFIITNVLWLLFRAETIMQWKGILLKIIYLQNTQVTDSLANAFVLPEIPFINYVLHLGKYSENIRGFWMLVFLMAAFGICLIPNNNYRNLRKVNAVTVFIAAIAFVWSVLSLGGESVFVYFNF